jgi:membrane protein YqaA with SNARE-associated domain
VKSGGASHPALSSREYRAWFAAFIALFAVPPAVVLFLISRDVLEPSWAFQAGIWVWYSLANTFCPLNTTAPIVAVSGLTGLELIPIVLVATLGTVLANLNEYHVLARMLDTRRGERIRRSRFYGAAGRYFDRAPFLLQAAVNLLPVIPVDVVRWIAIARRYPRAKFALATAAGRLPRYLGLAFLARVFQPRWPAIVALVILLAIPGLVGLAARWLGRTDAAPDSPGDA